MGDKISLKLEKRELHGKKVAKLRKQGLVPGVVYGSGLEPISVQGEFGEVAKVVAAAGTHTPIHLPGFKRSIAMIKDVDIDPVKNRVRHVAFHAVKADEPVEAEVPIRLVGEGESEAERAGLVVLQAIDKILVKALPMDLPDALEVDIRSLALAGDRVTIGDIKLPSGVEIVDNDDGQKPEDEDEEVQTIADLVVANVYEPGALQAANEAAGGDAEDESEVASDNGSEAAPAADDETKAA